MLLQLVIWVGWLVTLLWGSILAARGARNWATILQVIGTSGMLAGMLSLVIGSMFFVSTMTRGMASGSGSSAVARSDTALTVVMMAGGILLLLGVILFTAGYVGMCARYGATERRSRELEGLVGQLQQRIQSGM